MRTTSLSLTSFRCHLLAQTLCLAGALLTTTVPLLAQTEASGRSTLGLEKAEVTASVEASARAAGGESFQALRRVVDSLDQQLPDRLHNTRRFELVARADLEKLLREQELQTDLVPAGDPRAAQMFQMAGCQYLLVVTLDHFHDMTEHLRGNDQQILASRHTLQAAAVARLYDTTSGTIRETARVQAENRVGERLDPGIATNANRNQDRYSQVAGELAEKIGYRVMEVIFPARVLARTGPQVTLNRGDGTGIAVGQIWTVYAQGQALIDPDTGENLGTEEVAVGKVEITQVTPRFSQARILEDFGIDRGQVLRYQPETFSSSSSAGQRWIGSIPFVEEHAPFELTDASLAVLRSLAEEAVQ